MGFVFINSRLNTILIKQPIAVNFVSLAYTVSLKMSKSSLLLLVRKYAFIFLLSFWLLPEDLVAQIQVNNITATPSTCPNNGTITIHAITSAPPLLYSITAGPVIQPVQTNSIFTSLPPGSYTIDVSDGGGNHSLQAVTITGNYLSTDFTIAKQSPYCAGASDGKLTGSLVPGTGLAPFSWQLIAPSPITTPLQSSPLFENLPAGNYAMRVTDACNNLRTIAVTLSDPNTSYMIGELTAEKVGCDSMLIRYVVLVNELRMPFSFSYLTSNGTFVPTSGTSIDTSLVHLNHVVFIEQLIPGLTYGDNIQAFITDECGNTTTSTVLTTYPFFFYPKFNFNQCGSEVLLILENAPDAYSPYHTHLNHPITYTLTETSGNTTVTSGTAPGYPYTSGISINTPLAAGSTYHIVMTDGCGNIFEHDYTMPAQAPPQILPGDLISSACIDSVAGTYRIVTSNFTNPVLTILSGPSTLGSTKPGFEYTDTYSYPDTIDGGTGNNFSFFISNLAVGTYRYKVTDECGNELFDSLTIHPWQVTSLERMSSYKKGCPGQNTIYSWITNGRVRITDLTSHTEIKVREYPGYGGIYNRDSVMNVPSGPYEVSYEFLMDGQGEKLNDTDIPCWIVKDTLWIPPYVFPDIATSNSILCNNNLHMVLLPDSSKGVAPYEYEVIAGPQLFPLQNSNTFQVSIPGIYTVRIYDACGNASARQVTVDTISFLPPQTVIACNNTSIIFPTSPYYTYLWTGPGNHVFTGDSLILHPVTPADTGTYHIAKIIHINGCTDTLYASYHVTLNNHFSQTISFCAGTVITVGPNIYTQPGIYHDTLTTLQGCDSTIVTSLLILPVSIDTNSVTICRGQSHQVGTNTYTDPGIYTDSVQNASGCYDYIITELSVSGGAFVQNSTICSNDSLLLGNIYYRLAGTYTDTLTTLSGCDSIVTLHLSILPLTTNTLNQQICQGQNFIFAGNTYTQTGTYSHTFQTQACDSMVTLYLTVLPLKQHVITEEICSGNLFFFGGQSYGQSGTYTDTISTSSCDSVVTLYLIVHPGPTVHATISSYDIQPGDIVQLNAVSNSHPLIYSWTSEATLTSYTISNPKATINSSYWAVVTVMDTNGCIAMDSIFINMSVTSTLYVPNSFTPNNGDGTNDIFRVKYTNISEFNIMIFDRWGEIIFESNDIDFGWDGTYKGLIVQDGIYVYKIQAIGSDYKNYDIAGHITVIK